MEDSRAMDAPRSGAQDKEMRKRWKHMKYFGRVKRVARGKLTGGAGVCARPGVGHHRAGLRKFRFKRQHDKLRRQLLEHDLHSVVFRVHHLRCQRVEEHFDHRARRRYPADEFRLSAKRCLRQARSRGRLR